MREMRRVCREYKRRGSSQQEAAATVTAHSNGDSMDKNGIDERVENLMKDHVRAAGNELQAVWEVLCSQRDSSSEDFRDLSNPWKDDYELGFGVDNDVCEMRGIPRTVVEEVKPAVEVESFLFPPVSPIKYSHDKWTSGGGDWRLLHREGHCDIKAVLNCGVLLCDSEHSVLPDPRKLCPSSFHPIQKKKMELPSWASKLSQKNEVSTQLSQKNEASIDSASNVTQQKHVLTPKSGNHHITAKLSSLEQPKEKPSRAPLPPKKTDIVDGKNKKLFSEPASSSQLHRTPDKQAQNSAERIVHYRAPEPINIQELDLSDGEWYYKDGSGSEQGPFSFLHLQSLVSKELLLKGTSVYRKSDDIWVPIFTESIDDNAPKQSASKKKITTTIHDSVMGYTCGQLHEYVMKYYKNQVLSAFLHEGLDTRAKLIESARAAKISSSTIDTASPNHASPSGSDVPNYENGPSRMKRLFKSSEEKNLVRKRRRLLPYIDEEQISDHDETEAHSGNNQTWDTLEQKLLMKMFHHLRGDFKTLSSVLATCKAWNSAARKFKSKVRHLDLTSLGSHCTQSVLDSVQSYGGGKLKHIILRDCTMLSPEALILLLEACPSISDVDISGCSQFGDVIQSFPQVNWVCVTDGDSDASDSTTQLSEDSHCKMKSLKHIGASSRKYRHHHDEADYDEAEPMDIDSYGGEHEYESLTHYNGYKRMKLSEKVLKRPLENGFSKPKGMNGVSHKKKNAMSSKKLSRRSLEKDLNSVLKQLLDADTNRLFYHKPNGQRMDLATVERKLSDGLYTGSKEAFMSFKSDLFQVSRWSIQMEKDSPQFIAGKRVYNVTQRLLSSLEDTYFSAERHSQTKIVSNGLSTKYVLKGKTSKFNYGGDQQKGKALVKKRKELEETHWTESDTDSSDDDVLYETGEETGSDSENEIEARAVGVVEEVYDEEYTSECFDIETREWGARMTKAAMVPPLTRKYVVIEDYCIVIDKELVDRKMRVEIPEDYEKMKAAMQKNGGEFSHLDVPEVKEHAPRKQVGEEVTEQEVYGIEPYTYNLLLDTMPKLSEFTDKRLFVEEKLLQALNKEVNKFTGTGKAPMEYPLEPVVQRILDDAEIEHDVPLEHFCQALLKNMKSRPKDKYVAYRKGLGVVCNQHGGFKEDEFVVEFLGEVYPPWRWYEKQDAIRSLQKKDKDPAPEFYNILLERPKGDADGYDLVVVDAMHKANFASRICHSCRPNCEARVTAVNKRYMIGVYTLRPIQDGEELTFDYNSVTESKEEYNNSICLCGSQGCRGSYLNLGGANTFLEVIKEHHGLLDRHHLLLEACSDGPVTKEEWDEMVASGVGPCLLSGLPDWILKYVARLVRFMKYERSHLPEEWLKGMKKKKREFFYEYSRTDAEVQAEGVFNSRLQTLAITLDKVRYVLSKLFSDPREAPPLLKKLEYKALIEKLWKGDGSVVGELLKCMTPHLSKDEITEFKRRIDEHSPDENLEGSLKNSLLWLRDELRALHPTCLARHDAAADLVHMYAYTEYFFASEEYGSFDSPPLRINSLDLGRHANGPSYTWKKTYSKEYVLGQLIYWFKQNAADPGATLSQARRGCLVLPDFASCYAKGLGQDFRRAYGTRLRDEMLPRLECKSQKQWPKSQLWEFKNNRGMFGSPILDAVRRNGGVDKEMMHWLRMRSVDFVGPYDE